MAKRISGTCFIKVDGTQLEVKGNIETPVSAFSREAIMGLNGVAGYKETAKRPFVKLDAIVTPDFPITLLQTGTAMTITVEFANGKVFTLSSAFMEGDGNDVNGEDGSISLEFSGITGIWQ